MVPGEQKHVAYGVLTEQGINYTLRCILDGNKVIKIV
jgi:hypothetical protein